MSYEQGEASPEFEEHVLTSALVAALVAGVVAGIVLQLTGRMASVAGVYGFDGVLVGWVLLLLHSLVAGGLFGALVVPIVTGGGGLIADALSGVGPYGTSSVIGLVYGFVLWLVGVAFFVPILMTFLADVDRPIPYLHTVSLAALLAFGLVLGLAFAIVYEMQISGESGGADPL